MVMTGDYPPDHRSGSARPPRGAAPHLGPVGWSATPETADDRRSTGGRATPRRPDDRRPEGPRPGGGGRAAVPRGGAERVQPPGSDRGAWGGAGDPGRASDPGPAGAAAVPVDPGLTADPGMTSISGRMTGLLRRLDDRRNRPDGRGRHP